MQYWAGVGEERSAKDTKRFKDTEDGRSCCDATKGRNREKEERAWLDGGATMSSN